MRDIGSASAFYSVFKIYFDFFYYLDLLPQRYMEHDITRTQFRPDGFGDRT